MLIGEIESRFKKVDDFETYSKPIKNGGYDSDNFILTGWLYKLNELEFNKVNRSQYGKGTAFKQHIVEYIGKKCYIPTSGNCFIECISHLNAKSYMNEFLTFIHTEERRSNVMTSARIQQFCRRYNIKFVYYDGFRV